MLTVQDAKLKLPSDLQVHVGGEAYDEETKRMRDFLVLTPSYDGDDLVKEALKIACYGLGGLDILDRVKFTGENLAFRLNGYSDHHALTTLERKSGTGLMSDFGIIRGPKPKNPDSKVYPKETHYEVFTNHDIFARELLQIRDDLRDKSDAYRDDFVSKSTVYIVHEGRIRELTNLNHVFRKEPLDDMLGYDPDHTEDEKRKVDEQDKLDQGNLAGLELGQHWSGVRRERQNGRVRRLVRELLL